MLSYLLLSYITLLIGTALYLLLIRRRFSALLRKRAVLMLLAISVAMPLYCVYQYRINPEPQVIVQHQIALTNDICNEYCFADPASVDSCWSLAISQAQFCHCAHIEKKNIIVYHNNNWYSFLSKQENTFASLIIGAGVLLVVSFTLQIIWLLYIIATSKQETLYIAGKKIILLRPRKKMPIGSFYLWNKYMIWQDSKQELNAQEREAILMHEYSHIRQKDTWIKMFIHLAQVLWCVHPAYYFLRRELLRLSEHIADEAAALHLGNVRQYAYLLLKMESREPLPAALSAFSNSLLHERIQYLLNPQLHHYRLPTTTRYWSSIVIAAVAIVMSFSSQRIFPYITQQTDRLQVYEALQHEYETCGKTIFCAHCLAKSIYDKDIADKSAIVE